MLWIFIFLFVVAFEFSTAAREEASAAHRFNEETEGYYLAVAGFERGLYDFFNQQGGAPPSHRRKKTIYSTAYGASILSVLARSACGLSMKAAKSTSTGSARKPCAGFLPILASMVRAGTFSSTRLWTGAMRTICTAPTARRIDYYAALAPAYTVRNGPLDSVDGFVVDQGHDARAVFRTTPKRAGAAPDQPRGIALRDIFTIDSPIDRVNLRTAPAEVIHALIGIPLERCRGFVEERKKVVG